MFDVKSVKIHLLLDKIQGEYPISRLIPYFFKIKHKKKKKNQARILEQKPASILAFAKNLKIERIYVYVKYVRTIIIPEIRNYQVHRLIYSGLCLGCYHIISTFMHSYNPCDRTLTA